VSFCVLISRWQTTHLAQGYETCTYWSLVCTHWRRLPHLQFLQCCNPWNDDSRSWRYCLCSHPGESLCSTWLADFFVFHDRLTQQSLLVTNGLQRMVNYHIKSFITESLMSFVIHQTKHGQQQPYNTTTCTSKYSCSTFADHLSF